MRLSDWGRQYGRAPRTTWQMYKDGAASTWVWWSRRWGVSFMWFFRTLPFSGRFCMPACRAAISLRGWSGRPNGCRSTHAGRVGTLLRL